MNETAPAFAVVGRTNKGKSSIVSTFIEDESVAVDSRPGTTRTCSRFEVRDDNRRVLSVIHDTPGFEDAPAALQWLTEHEGAVTDRAQTVADFVAEFRDSGRFRDECSLLQPILDGASILYVVDGAVPYRSSYEAEMEILRWTGRPRMALINRIGEGDHSEEWRRALEQYFSIVRVFDAHGSGFEERVGLLRAFRELSEDGRDAIDEAITLLERDWKARRAKTAGYMADLLVDALSFTIQEKIAPDASMATLGDQWRQRFFEELRHREKRERAEIETLYRHDRTERQESELESNVIEEDLFAGTHREVLGLSTWQLVRAGTVGGAAVGATVDVATGGSSFLAGTLVGGVLGGLTTYYGGRTLGEAKVLGKELGGTVVRVGPIKEPNFPWILLDRAVLHYETVLDRAHAERDVMVVAKSEGKQGVSATLASRTQSRLGGSFAKVRKNADEVPLDLRQDLQAEILSILDKRFG